MKKQLPIFSAPVSGAKAEGMDGALTLSGARGEIALSLDLSAAALSEFPYLIVDVLSGVSSCEAVFVRFWEASGRVLEMHTMLFPGVRARAVFRLKFMDGSLLFPPLNPGTLKTNVAGQGVNPEQIARFALGFLRGRDEERQFTIYEAYLSDELPDFPAAKETNADALGQWKQKSWPGKTRDEAALKDMLRSEEQKEYPPMKGRDRFGGSLLKRFPATGFFRVQKENGRWFLVDPEGGAFFSSGVFGVYPGEPGWILGVTDHLEALPDPDGPFAPAYERAGNLELYRRKFSGMFPDDTLLFAPATANLIRAFGDEWYDRWAKLTARRLRAWGVNTLSMFSDPEFIKRAKMPYVVMMKGYPVTGRTIFREFPDVFSDEYDALCRDFAKQLSAYRDDPLLIGYFLNNEPTWGFVPDILLAEKLLETGRGMASLDALIAFLKERYKGDIQALNEKWKLSLASFEEMKAGLDRAGERSEAAKADLTEFTAILIDRYAALPAKYAREAAPNHLNLGMRFASVNHTAMLRTARSFDVFSLNCYAAYPTDALNALEKTLDMPMLVGEFHFGALDAGLPAPSLFWVRDQAARGAAYARYLTRAAAHKNGVGAHYFAYNDQPLWGRYDGENYQFGFVDVCNRPYAPFIEGVQRANESIYDVMLGRTPPEGGETERL